MTLVNNDNFALELRSLFLSENKRDVFVAIESIKYKLINDNDNLHVYIKLLLDNDILDFLLNYLSDLNQEFLKDIILILNYMSGDKLFFSNEYLSRSALVIIRTIYYLIKDQNIKQVTVFVELLKLLALFYERLNYCSSFKDLHTILALDAILAILDSIQKPDIYVATLLLIKSIISYKSVKMLLSNNNFIYKILEAIVKVINLLEQIQIDSKKDLVLKLCLSCKEFLIFSNNFLSLDLPDIYYKLVYLCLYVHNNLCLDILSVLNINKHFIIYHFYLEFLLELLKNISDFEKLKFLSKSLTEKNIFTKIAECLNLTNDIKDFSFEKKLKYRNDSLKILCIIMALESSELLYDFEMVKKFEMYLNDGLQYTANDIFTWDTMLQYHTTSSCTINSIIVFYCFFYIHAKNYQKFKSSNCTILMKYITTLRRTNSIPEIVLKKLYLLYSVYHAQYNEMTSEYFLIVKKAGEALIQLINSFQTRKTIDILTSDIKIINWIFSSTTMGKEIEIQVTEKWLEIAKSNINYDLILTYFAAQNNKFCYLLVYMVNKNAYDNVDVASSILKFLFTNSILKNDKILIRHIMMVMYSSLQQLSRISNPEHVFKKIPLINLSLTILPELKEQEIYLSTIQSFISVFEYIGFNDIYPLDFYKAILKGTNLIINLAKRHSMTEIQSEFINAKRFLKIVGYCLVSNDRTLSFEATKFFKNILLYQFKQRKNSHCTVKVDERVYEKLLCLKCEETLMESISMISTTLNVTIHKIDPVITFYVISDSFFVLTYERFLSILNNPKLKIKKNIIWNILMGILYYGCRFKQDVNLSYWLLNHVGNHILIQMESHSAITQSISTNYFQFILKLLEYVNSNEQIKSIILKRYFVDNWSSSLHEIAIQLFQPNNDKDNNLCKNIAKQLILFKEILSTNCKNKVKQIYNLQ